jgi:hypothetical protein
MASRELQVTLLVSPFFGLDQDRQMNGTFRIEFVHGPLKIVPFSLSKDINLANNIEFIEFLLMPSLERLFRDALGFRLDCNANTKAFTVNGVMQMDQGFLHRGGNVASVCSSLPGICPASKSYPLALVESLPRSMNSPRGIILLFSLL